MVQASREFQIFVKPTGGLCNLACHYCYYLPKTALYPSQESLRMADDILEGYIVQHIRACPGENIRFSWHGGEPTILGLDYFRKITALQHKHLPPGRFILNGIQTNGTLLDEAWCRFLAAENFVVGLSLDGPQDLHDRCRVFKDQGPSFVAAQRGYELLARHKVQCDILCVVNAVSSLNPAHVYRFFKKINACSITFLPLVEPHPEKSGIASKLSIAPDVWGDFLCTIFDEWLERDIGRIKVQIFEEAARAAFHLESSLCIFRETCGDVPVLEHNGDFFSCDHYVDSEHLLGNIRETSLVKMLESPTQKEFGQAKKNTLPRYCRSCEVRNMCHGECPKNRFLSTPDNEPGLNYLCAGYKKFFRHCRPWVEEVAQEWQRQKLAQTGPAELRIGRNDPCPCGSGLKYKKCCMPD